MRAKGTSIPILLMLLFMTLGAYSGEHGTEKQSDWYLARKAEGITLYYRWITLENGREAREMKATFIVNAGIPKIVTHFSSSESYKQWASGIKSCEVEKQNDSLWFTHSLMNYPFPFRKKDVVTRHELQHFKDHSIIEIVAAPDHKPKCKNVERIKSYRGSWNFYSLGTGETSVECLVLSGDKPLLPRFMQDPVVQKLTIESFSELKHLAEAQ